ncbi:tail tape measure [Achromobacter phage phiAxp-1]|uniref:tail length tape measure protein n=1 Tax=Achromobacter phage phiAxp-1 TaxID=1610509 RepID=UPI00065668B6|nr:tail length tape measure protein [Achromobacter phage phiAxp-1]AKJ71378.1 tail tape measure [Achromobacter phage phiAxp-1]
MSIAIEITDKVSGNIEKKIDGIARSSREAHGAVKLLRDALNTINDSALRRMLDTATTNTARLNTEANKAALSAAKLATEQQKAAAAAQRLQTETQRTAKAAADAAAAQTRAQAAADKLAQSQQRAAQATEKHAQGLQTLKGILASLGLAAAAAQVLKMADAYTNLQNKLQNVATSQAQVNEITNRTFELANRTRTDVDATATAFTRFDRALKMMGKSQEDTFRMTETVNKGLIVSGSTASEAASTLLQLSQAFNAGKLQGDEFRSLAENFPMIMDATAKAMGVTVDQVKKFSSEGKITSRVMFDALKLLEGQVDATFAKTTPTIAQAGVVLRNSMIQSVGEMNKALGVTKMLAQGMLFLADNMNLVIPAAVGVGTALVIAFGPALLRVLGLATNAVKVFTGALAANPIGLVAVALTTLATAIGMYIERTKAATTETAIMRDYMVAAFSYISDAWNAVTKFFGDAWDTATKYVTDVLAGWGTTFDEVFSAVSAGVKQYANLVIQIWQVAFETISFVWGNFPALMKNFFVAVYNFSAGVVESVVNSWQSGMKLIADSIESFAPSAASGIREVLESTRLELTRLEYDSGGLNATQNYLDRIKDIFASDAIGSVADDWAKRASDATQNRLQLAREQADSLRGAGPGMPTTPDAGKGNSKDAKRYKYADALREMEREIELLKLTRTEREKLAQLNQLEDKLGKDKLGNVITFNAEQKKTLLGMIEEQNLLRNRAAMLEELRGPETAMLEGQQALNSLLSDGAITAEEYTNKMRDLNLAFLETQTTMEGGFQRGILKAQKDMGDLSKLTENFVTNGVQGMEDAFVELATTGKMNFSKFAQSIISDLARMAVRALITRAILMAIGAISGSIGGMNAVSAGPAMGSAVGAGGSLESFMSAGGGFSKGGWTGNSAKDQIAGVVHGQEFVVKAGPASANRELLEAMNRGQAFAPSSSDAAPSSTAPTSSFASSGYPSSPVGGQRQPGSVVINNYQSDKIKVEATQTENEDGSMNIDVMVDLVEGRIADKMSAGMGPMFNATRDQFGLRAAPKGG